MAYFEDGHFDAPNARKDLQAVVEGVELAQAINGAFDAFMPGRREELPRGGQDLREFVKNESWGHHASCSCPMGQNDKTSVVNSKFLVHGTDNLRVVDASIFPKIPGFFIVSAIYTISERASDDVLVALGKQPRIAR